MCCRETCEQCAPRGPTAKHIVTRCSPARSPPPIVAYSEHYACSRAKVSRREARLAENQKAFDYTVGFCDGL